MLQEPASQIREKSPEAFRTISEVSVELDIPQHVLRFWESRFSQIRPIKRAGGRRYYRPEDIDLLRGIRALLYGDGFTIKGAQKVIREKGQRHVSEIGRIARTGPVRTIPIKHVEVLHEGTEDPEYIAVTLDDEARVRLEILLAELQQMRAQLRAARMPK